MPHSFSVEKRWVSAVISSPSGPVSGLHISSVAPWAMSGQVAALGDPPVPGHSAPGDSSPGDSAPGDSAPGDSAPGDSAPGDSAPGDSAPGDSAPDVASAVGPAAGVPPVPVVAPAPPVGAVVALLPPAHAATISARTARSARGRLSRLFMSPPHNRTIGRAKVPAMEASERNWPYKLARTSKKFETELASDLEFRPRGRCAA